MVFNLRRLEALHGDDTAETEHSSYAQNGMDQKRIKHALKHPGCSCGCSMPFKLLVQICCSFWTLSKGIQDSLLWTLQTELSRKRKVKWRIEGFLNNKSFAFGYSILIDYKH